MKWSTANTTVNLIFLISIIYFIQAVLSPKRPKKTIRFCIINIDGNNGFINVSDRVTRDSA
jgi:hypothetical protein